jgi:hypothetical protein
MVRKNGMTPTRIVRRHAVDIREMTGYTRVVS